MPDSFRQLVEAAARERPVAVVFEDLHWLPEAGLAVVDELAAALRGLDDEGIALSGNCAGGHFVRSGRSASFAEMAKFLDAWSTGTLRERL